MLTKSIPLAERMRPTSLDTFIGQEHLVGPKGIMRRALESDYVPSMIFWGPPGVGKTTLANIIANQTKARFFTLSAISSGVKEVREVIAQAQGFERTILFIDEIHRFSKSQQDALLGAVEKGTIKLIGATTENPSFEVNSALLSRCQVYVLENLTKGHLIELLKMVIKEDDQLSQRKIKLKETDALLTLSGGDARKLLNLLELVVDAVNEDKITITDALVTELVQQRAVVYDKKGDMHYDIISAFIKSMRGSDPNGAVYWLARMIEGGEDPKFIARRMLILASEDIGNANPTALVIAMNCFQAVSVIGYPEARIVLSQTATYLASSAKSNAAYMAINKSQQIVKNQGDLQVPLHLRGAYTELNKDLGYGAQYKYSHDYPGNFVTQEFLPDEIKGAKLYDPGENAREKEMRARLKSLWKNKYEY